jgi:hypothetical protein
MNNEPRNKRFGDTMSDYIVQVANELPYDAVGMWQIVPGGLRSRRRCPDGLRSPLHCGVAFARRSAGFRRRA